jgi:hypothetical protein
VRLSPRSIFIGIVTAGLPFAVAIGWAIGNPSDTPTTTVRESIGGAAGIGTAPTTALSRSTAPVADAWTTRTPPRPVSVGTVAQSARPRSSASARPSISSTGLPEPTVTVPPEVTPTTTAPEATAPATDPPASETPEESGGLLQRWR